MTLRAIATLLTVLVLGSCIDSTGEVPTDTTETPATTPVDAPSPPKDVNVACDGALCDTSNDSTCNAGGGSVAWPIAGAMLLLALGTRRRRRWLAGGVAIACVALGLDTAASAEVKPVTTAAAPAAPAGSDTAGSDDSVSVHVDTAPPPVHRFTLAWNPLPFIVGLGKISVDAVIMLKHDHHALVISPFLAITNTAPIFTVAPDGTPSQLPQQNFTTFGAEIGYRHYWGVNGPRGLFIGPSLLLADVQEKQGMFGDGSKTSYGDLGLAFDIGYQAVFSNSFTLAVGAGVQGQLTTMSNVPRQQFPADVYANNGVWPRLLLSVGYAF
jgi:uncharacterized protein (TIGR03382 family)